MIAWAESVEHTVHLSEVERLFRRPTAPTSFTDFTSAGVKLFGSETQTRIQIHKTRLKVSSSGTHKV